MKNEAAGGSNGIGPLVRQYVHERNAARKAGESAPNTTPAPAPSTGDTVEFSTSALARFEAWKAKHAPAPVEEPASDPVDPGTETAATETPAMETPATETPVVETPVAEQPAPLPDEDLTVTFNNEPKISILV